MASATFIACALIFRRASAAYHGKLVFSDEVISKIFDISMGYPYFTQLIGKRCVEQGNLTGTNNIEIGTLNDVLEEISSGRAFPHLERKYQRAVGDSNSRALLLTLLAEENVSLDDVEGGISLKAIRTTAQELDIEYMDQLVQNQIGKQLIHILPGSVQRPENLEKIIENQLVGGRFAGSLEKIRDVLQGYMHSNA